jgi:aryl-alcohol dehydrogenase-like predicted oxidoreductase
MQYRSFGSTGMEVSRLCLGGMTFSREIDLDTTRRVVDEALDSGINFIDTAESYGDSEEFLGRALHGRRERVYLATKVYTQRIRDGRAGRNSRGNILFSLDRSLRLLGTDYVDLFQLHHPDEQTPLDETLSAMDLIIKQGKARYLGVTNHYAWQVSYMLAMTRRRGGSPIASLQCRYNVLDRIAEVETISMARRLGLALMTYAPLSAGMLSGKYHRGETRKPHTRSEENEKLQKLLSNDAAFDVIDRLREIAREQSVELNQLAWMWLLSKPDVTTPIVGGSKLEHFRSIYSIADRRLSPEVVRRIDDLSAGFIYRRWENQPAVDGPPV